MDNIGNVYMIINPKGKIYVGSTKFKDCTKRWNLYKKLVCKTQTKLYNSFKKYGVNRHIFKVLWTGNIDELFE